MGKKQRDTSLDSEAVAITAMDVRKGAFSVACFRCKATKASAVLAKWSTSKGVKDLCQGCAGLVHQLAAGKGAAPKDKDKPAAAKSAPPKGCCEACGVANVLVAAGVGHEACVKAWLDAGASVEFSGRKKIERPLHKACANGHAAAATVLLDRGASVDARDKAGRTALYRAADGGKADVVALLIARGADKGATASGDDDTPLAAAVKSLKMKRRRSTKPDEVAKAAQAAAARARVVELLGGTVKAPKKAATARPAAVADGGPGVAPAKKTRPSSEAETKKRPKDAAGPPDASGRKKKWKKLKKDQ